MTEKPYRLAVRAILVDPQDRCLLLRRSAQCRSFVGTWEFPGGKAEPGENLDEALRREVREEAGLDIAIDGVAGAYGIDLPAVRAVVVCLYARPAGGALCISPEHDQHAWVPLDQLLQWNFAQDLRRFVEGWLPQRLLKK